MSDATTAPHDTPPDEREELARAEVYGLLATLFHAAPSDALYGQLQVAVTEAPVPGAFLERSWTELVATSRRLARGAVDEEYTALFGGLAKPEVALQASWFVGGTLNDRPLVELRDDLAALGLERPPGVLETEDHIAALCEVMRLLIAGDDPGAGGPAVQQRFFDRHLRGWVERLCDTIDAHPRADFYRALAGFTRDFLAVEAQGFDLLEA